MDTKNPVIEKGMRVLAADDTDLGKVTHLWTGVGDTPTAPQNFVVAGEGGFFGMGERDLYIPFEAVERVIPGESVTVASTSDECVAPYSVRPEGMRFQARGPCHDAETLLTSAHQKGPNTRPSMAQTGRARRVLFVSALSPSPTIVRSPSPD